MSINFVGHTELMDEDTTSYQQSQLSGSHSPTLSSPIISPTLPFQSHQNPYSPVFSGYQSPDSVVLTLEQEKSSPKPKMYKPTLHRLKTFIHEKEHQVYEIIFNANARRQFIRTYFSVKNVLTCIISTFCFLLLLVALIVGILLIPTRSNKTYIGSFIWVDGPSVGGGIHTTSQANAIHPGQSLESTQSTLANSASTSDIKVFNAYSESITDTLGSVENAANIVGGIVVEDSYFIFWGDHWEERSASNDKPFNWKGSSGSFSGTAYGIGYANDLKNWMVLLDKSGSRTNFVVSVQDGTEWSLPDMSNQVVFGRVAKHGDQVLVLATLESGDQELFEIDATSGTATSISLNDYRFHALDENRYGASSDPGFLAMGSKKDEYASAGYSYKLKIDSGAVNVEAVTHFIDIGELNERLSFYSFYSYPEINSGETTTKEVTVVTVLNHENRLYSLNPLTSQVYADSTINNVSTIGLNPNIKTQ